MIFALYSRVFHLSLDRRESFRLVDSRGLEPWWAIFCRLLNSLFLHNLSILSLFHCSISGSLLILFLIRASFLRVVLDAFLPNWAFRIFRRVARVRLCPMFFSTLFLIVSGLCTRPRDAFRIFSKTEDVNSYLRSPPVVKLNPFGSTEFSF